MSSTPNDPIMNDPAQTPGLNDETPRPLGQAMSLGGDSEKLADYYGAWASTYDADVGGADYGLPGSVLTTLDAVIAIDSRFEDRELTVLDAGCGTGRIAMALAARGYQNIDGVDLSPEMVEIARTRRRDDGSPIYAELEAEVDLTIEPSPRWLASADLVVIGGVFTVGHIAPESLWQVAKLVRPNGVLITTVRPGYFDTTNYAQVSADLVASDAAELLAEFESLPYTADSDGRFYAYRIN